MKSAKLSNTIYLHKWFIQCIGWKEACVMGLNTFAVFFCSVDKLFIYFINFQDLLRPAANLADRMRGRLEYVNKKMKIIRSRSAERLRGYILSEANNQTPDTEVSGQSSPSSSSQSQQCSPLEPNIPIL